MSSIIISTRWIFVCLIFLINSMLLYCYIGWLGQYVVNFKLITTSTVMHTQIGLVAMYAISVFVLSRTFVGVLGSFFLMARKTSKREQDIVRGNLAVIEIKRKQNRIKIKQNEYPQLFASLYVIPHKSIIVKIIDEDYITAYAYGRRNLAISRGTLEELGDEELQAVLAHEIAHLLYNDTKYEAIYSEVVYTFFRFFGLIVSLQSVFKLLFLIPSLLFLPLILLQILLANIYVLINSAYSRMAEYRADRYSAWITGGIPNQSFFEYTRKYDVVDDKTPFTFFTASHPPIELRRDRIEQFINKLKK